MDTYTFEAIWHNCESDKERTLRVTVRGSDDEMFATISDRALEKAYKAAEAYIRRHRLGGEAEVIDITEV